MTKDERGDGQEVVLRSGVPITTREDGIDGSRGAILDATAEGGRLAGMVDQEVRTEEAKEKVMQLARPLRITAKREYMAVSPNDSVFVQAVHEDVGDALSEAADDLYDKGLGVMVKASRWNERDEEIATLATVEGNDATNAVIKAYRNQEHGIPLVGNSIAYPTNVDRVFVFTQVPELETVNPRVAQIAVVTPAFMESRKLRPEAH